MTRLHDDNRPMYGLSAVFTIVDQLPPITLVSNTGQTRADVSDLRSSRSPSRRAAIRGGYTLTSVDVGLGNVSTVRTKLFRIVPEQPG